MRTAIINPIDRLVLKLQFSLLDNYIYIKFFYLLFAHFITKKVNCCQFVIFKMTNFPTFPLLFLTFFVRQHLSIEI